MEFYNGRPRADVVERVRLHLSLCPTCLEAARDYCEFSGIKAIPETIRSSKWVFHPNVAVAAAILLVFVIGGIWVSTNPKMDPSRPATRGAAVQTEIQIIGPSGDLRKVVPVLEWRPVRGANVYEVEVRDVRLNVIWKQSGITEPRISLPSNIISQLQLGDIYAWHVTAQSAGGNRIASGFANFKINPFNP